LRPHREEGDDFDDADGGNHGEEEEDYEVVDMGEEDQEKGNSCVSHFADEINK